MGIAIVPGLSDTSVVAESASERDEPFRILSLDGGGIRGVCTAAYLARLEEMVGPPIRRYFDLICGTSAGGIIAIALALDIPAKEILKLFHGKALTIFDRRHPRLPKWIAMACNSLYRNDTFHGSLRDVLGPDSQLGDARCRLCIPAVNISTGRVVVFKTRHAEYLVRDHRLKAWHVAAATSAAPIYFSPFHIPNSGEHVDGGLWANVPSIIGFTEGLRLGKSVNDMSLLSIGTGSYQFQRSADRYKKKWFLNKTPLARDGLFGWHTDLVELPFLAQADSSENFMLHLLGDRKHCRIQFRLPPGGLALDAVDSIDQLTDIALEEAKYSALSTAGRFLTDEATPFEPLPSTEHKNN